MSTDKKKHSVDRRSFSVVSLQEQENESKNWWHDKTPQERMEALETTRQLIYGYDPTTTRLQRVLKITKLT